MALIIGGETSDTRAHVIDWRSHGLKFELGTNNSVGKRRASPRLLIVHYSGGENPPPTIYKTLCERGLSCEFAMDLHGMIWQFADPAAVFCGHCQGMNKVSFGIEIQSRGLVQPPSAVYKRTWDKWSKEIPRGTYQATLSRNSAAPYVNPLRKRPGIAGDEKVSYASFTADQLTALVDFIDGL